MLTRNRKRKAYDVALALYDTLETDEFGVNVYTTKIYETTTALILSPDSKWQDVRDEVWKAITSVYGAIDRAEKTDYTFNLGMSYTIDNSENIRRLSRHLNDRAFFGLLGRDDITELQLRINATYRYGPLREHLEKTKTRKALEYSSRDPQESVENLKVEKSESTVSIKETNTHSCIIQ